MILEFGDYQHTDNECNVTINRQGLFSSAGIPYAYAERWTISGALLCDQDEDTPAAAVSQLTSRIQALEEAYRKKDVSIRLLTSTGESTAHEINKNDTIGGIRVVQPPSFTNGGGAEYATYRTYEVVLEADVLVVKDDDADDFVVEWNESVEMSGGLPEVVYTRPLRGIPQPQTVRTNTTYKAVQTGSAIGLKRYPPAAALPFWPQYVVDKRVRRTNPQTRGDKQINFGVQWYYAFESNSPLTGNPRSF